MIDSLKKGEKPYRQSPARERKETRHKNCSTKGERGKGGGKGC